LWSSRNRYDIIPIDTDMIHANSRSTGANSSASASANVSGTRNFNYDTHSLYINSGVATREQLVTALRQAMITTAKRLGRTIRTKFKVNVIVVRDVYLGYAHVYISNPEVYHMLNGFNPDGTERVTYVDDPNWVAPASATDTDEMDFDDMSFLQNPTATTTMSWSDLMAGEDAQSCPRIKVPLEPLMTLPPYAYEADQLLHIKQLLLEQSCKSGQEDVPIVIPTHGHFEVHRAYVQDLESKYSQDILCTRGIPD
jgi:hypothetical protein